MSRKSAREDAFKLIFEAQINKDSPEDILSRYGAVCGIPDEDGAWEYAPGGEDIKFTGELVRGTLSHLGEIDPMISKHLEGWSLSRIGKVSLAVMRLAVFEMLHRDDIPASVSINEAIELAKKYDSPEAGAFINGILGSIAKEI